MPDNLARDKLDALTDLQFLFVTGKGGVGKSTCAALLGLHAARRGRNALVVIPQSTHRPQSLFGQTLNREPRSILGQLSAAQIDADSAMREYCRQVLHSQTLTNALFHSKVAGGFLAGIPGLSDWALLGKSWAWTRSGTFVLPKNQKRYDLVIVDAPASGDGTKMLKVPQVIIDLSPQGRLHDDAALCQAMLADPKRSAVVVVSLAEDFAITETEENIRFVEDQLHFHCGPVFVNRMLEPQFSEQELTALATLAVEPGSKTEAMIKASLNYGYRQKAQCAQVQRLEISQRSIVQIPEVLYDLIGIKPLDRLLTQIISEPPVAGAKFG